MADYNYLSDGRPAGTVLGNDSSDPVGFWGHAPAARPTITAVATATATTTLNETKINRLYAALKAIGIINY